MEPVKGLQTLAFLLVLFMVTFWRDVFLVC